MNTPRELAPLLLASGRAGIESATHPTDAARLRFKRPTGAADLPPDLLARLRLHREAVLELLVNGYTPDDDEAGFVLGERLAMADGLGMPTHRGSAAWLVAVGGAIGNGCDAATIGVYSRHGETHGCDSSGGESKRRNPILDREGCKRGP